MAQIYMHAKTVLAWLGELPDAQIDKEKVKLAGAIAFAGRGIELLWPNTSIYLMNGLGRMIEEAQRDEGKRWSMAWNLSGIDANLSPCGIRALYENAWFTRIWIVQDAALARKLVFHYGAGSLDRADFERMCVLVFLFVETSHPYDPAPWNVFLSNCWRVVQAVHDSRRPGLKSWFKTVNTLDAHACREPTDRVYALLSLFPENSTSLFAVDYAKHPATVYTLRQLHSR